MDTKPGSRLPPYLVMPFQQQTPPQSAAHQVQDSPFNVTKMMTKFRVISKESIELTIPSTEETNSPFLASLLEVREEEVPTISMPDVSASTLLSFIQSLRGNVGVVSAKVEHVFSMLGMCTSQPKEDHANDPVADFKSERVEQADPSKSTFMEGKKFLRVEVPNGMGENHIKREYSEKSENGVFNSALPGAISPVDPIYSSSKAVSCFKKFILNKYENSQIMSSTDRIVPNKRFSDNVKEGCLIMCEICSKEVTVNYMRQHVVKQHGVKLAYYKAKFGENFKFVRQIFHHCRICGKEILLCWDVMNNHMRTHGISLKNYNKKEMMMEVENDQTLSSSEGKTN